MSRWHRLLLLLLLFQCAEAQTREIPEPRIHWDDIYRIYSVPNEEESRLRSLPGLERTMPATRTASGLIYRLPAERSMEIERLGFRPLKDVPFKYVDSDIERRRGSEDPSVWWSGYKDLEMVDRILSWLERSRPDRCRRYEIGRSVRGRPIWALRISAHPGRDEAKPSLLFNGAHHGNELLSIDYVLDLARSLVAPPGTDLASLPLTDKERTGILTGLEVWIVPVVNPDGVDDFWNRSILTARKNAHGVDLNRNYPFFWNSGTVGASGGNPASHDFRGPRPASEPETQAMMDFAERERFTLAFSYHTFATRILFPYTIDQAMNPWPDRAYYYAKTLAEVGISFRPSKSYEAARKLYPVDGTDQDWLFHSFGTMAFIVEGSMDSPEYPAGLDSIRGMRPVWLKAIRQVKDGPRIEITAVDAAGRPVSGAVVRALDEVSMEGEKWTVHPRSGRFDLMPGPQEDWVIEVSHPAFRTVQKKISCRGVCKEKFYLTRPKCQQDSLHAKGPCR